MPQNKRPSTLKDVIKFFVEEVDGTGLNDGHPRNPNTVDSLRKYNSWELGELTQDEFMCLVIPDGSNTLIKEKDLDTMSGSSRSVALSWIKRLENGEDMPPLIVRSRSQVERKDSSFGMEDGAHRAIAGKVYFENHPYKPIRAYIGK